MLKLLKTPKTVTFDGALLEEHAAKMSQNNSVMENIYYSAEKVYEGEIYSVTQRTIRPKSNDPHDYASMGPYWWPNPDTKDGLPYIRRDGERNPETNQKATMSNLFNSVHKLTLASYYLEDDRYAKAAVEHMRVWFIDEKTRMNPHLKYGQFIPGICDGRCFGLIDTSRSFLLMDSIMLLDAVGLMPEDVKQGVSEWYNRFLDWMLTSEIGVEEDNTKNNHGTWYDIQVISTALMLGRVELAKRQLELAYQRRILAQIDKDGKQPHELARTNGLGYSTYNLEGLCMIANMAKIAGVKIDMWHTKRESGDCALKSACDYLLKYIDSLDGFEYQQISKSIPRETMCRIALMAHKQYPNESYYKKAEKYLNTNMLFRLLPD